MRTFPFLPIGEDARRMAGHSAAHFLRASIPHMREIGMDSEADALADLVGDVEEVARLVHRADVSHKVTR